MNAATPDSILRDALRHARTVERRGRVVQAFGTTIRATGLDARIGQECEIVDHANGGRLKAQVVGFQDGAAILTPLTRLEGLSIDAEVLAGPRRSEIGVGDGLLGRVLDAHGEPLDGLGPDHRPAAPASGLWRGPQSAHPHADRQRLRHRRAQRRHPADHRRGPAGRACSPWPAAASRLCSGMFARHAQADVNVIALIGERGREVREFLDDCLGPEGLARSVVIVSTSDRPAMERVRAAHVATAIAEGFRARGLKVMLQMDSVTRFARALREIGLSVGEPAVRRGFPPSVFAELPRLFERAGAAEGGAITAFYTVLVEDEDGGDPVGEEVRSILDGHIYLSRKLGQAGHYPAIDIAASLSRVFPRVASADHQAQASQRPRLDGQVRRHRVPAADRRVQARRRSAGRRRHRQAAGHRGPCCARVPTTASRPGRRLRDPGGDRRMNPRRQLDILTPVVRLRERRVEVARQEAAAARDALAAAEDALAARDGAIALHDAALARLDAWFAEGLSGSAAMVETALARRDMVAEARARDVELRDQERVGGPAGPRGSRRRPAGAGPRPGTVRGDERPARPRARRPCSPSATSANSRRSRTSAASDF
jgi:type III secretion protein N (ATPase)